MAFHEHPSHLENKEFSFGTLLNGSAGVIWYFLKVGSRVGREAREGMAFPRDVPRAREVFQGLGVTQVTPTERWSY